LVKENTHFKTATIIKTETLKPHKPPYKNTPSPSIKIINTVPKPK
jgi:hypothetical protein